MYIFYDSSLIEGPFSVALGIFDGVHKGHQAILKKAQGLAKKSHIKSLAFSFDPHPLKILNLKNAPILIENIESRLDHFKQLNMDVAFIKEFDHHLANMNPENFVNDILVKKLQTQYLVVGEDFKFGKNQKGNIELLCILAKKYHFQCYPIAPIKIRNKRISSTQIREFILNADIENANKFLGYDFSLSGKVVHGDKRGRVLGFKTANIETKNELIPPTGVYACYANIDTTQFCAVVNIGFTPTFYNSKFKIEAHLLDYNDDNLYNKTITLQFIKKIRDEQKFSSTYLLKNQIEKDIKYTQKLLLPTCISNAMR